MRRRRFIPPAFAGAVLVICLSPLVFDIDPNTADLYTLPIAATIYAFMAIMFGWMRQRMIKDPRELTVFGVALVDFFTACTLLAVIWAIVWFIVFVYALDGVTPAPYVVRTLNRAAAITGGALFVGCGAAVGFEMRRVGPIMSVHCPPQPWDGRTERRKGPLDRRKEARS